jgi:ferredoxin
MYNASDEGGWLLEIDQDACLGTGTCVAISPRHFELDGPAAQPRARRIDPDESVVDCAECCPVEAIKILDATTGKVITPS